MKLCKRLESNINPKEIKYLSIILSSKLRKLYKLNFQRILNVIKLDMPWLNILLLSISGWINSVKMNASIIFISDNSLGGSLLHVLVSPIFWQFCTENKKPDWKQRNDMNPLKAQRYPLRFGCWHQPSLAAALNYGGICFAQPESEPPPLETPTTGFSSASITRPNPEPHNVSHTTSYQSCLFH